MGCTGSKSHDDNNLTGFRPIPDRFTSIDQVQKAVRAAGLESSNLILGVDFTKSNLWTGAESFGGRSLHDTSVTNPYESVIDILSRTLEVFDDDKLIPAYGFGDVTTGNKKCFPFMPHARPCQGVGEVLSRYKDIAAEVKLAGPTCFAPVIRAAIKITREEESYHILVIIADGQVTDPSSSGETAKAIIEASHYPLSIVVVGVGDGPWETMEHYDDELPERRFDNFQFVEWDAVRRSGQCSAAAMEARFALHALMEVPEQYAYIKKLGLLDPQNFPAASSMHRSPPLAPALAAASTASSPPLPITLGMQNGTAPHELPSPPAPSDKGDRPSWAADILPPRYQLPGAADEFGTPRMCEPTHVGLVAPSYG